MPLDAHFNACVYTGTALVKFSEVALSQKRLRITDSE